MANPPLRRCSFGTTTLPLGAQVVAKRSVVWDPNINNTHTRTHQYTMVLERGPRLRNIHSLSETFLAF